MRQFSTVTGWLFVIMAVLCILGPNDVSAQAGPTLYAPANGSVVTAPLTFSWSTITYATNYNLVVSYDPGFSTTVYNVNTGGSTSFSVSSLAKGRTYYWHVRAYVQNPITHEQYWTGWSATWFFVTPCPNPPNLTIPENGSEVTQPFQLFWNIAEGAQEYEVQVDNDMAFGSPEFSLVTSYLFANVNGLDNNVVYYWRVRSLTVGCTSNWSASFFFTTICPLPDPVDLESPTNGSTVDYGTDTWFEWFSLPDILIYNFQLDDNSDFSSPLYDETTSSIYYIIAGLSKGGTYYWRVRAMNTCGYGDWSSIWHVNLSCPEPSPPELSSPANGAADLSQPVVCSWYAVDGATNYEFELDDDPGLTSPEIDGSTGTNTFVNIPPYLTNGTTYYWRVRAEDECDLGDWSDIWSFTMECPLPAIPTLVSPDDAAVDVASPALLEWNEVSGISSYQIQIDDDPAFASLASNAELYGLGSTEFHAPSLTEAVTYYWKVRASNGCGWGDWSSTRSFVPLSPLSGLCGDVDLDGTINILDIVYTINYIYKNGPDPCNPPKK